MIRIKGTRDLGQYRERATGRVVNMKTGRQVGRSVDLKFYLHSGRRVYVSDREFYDEWELFTLPGKE